jgi:hypothetical protein
MLRSARNILGHRVSAKDGELGHCIDFLVDPLRWSVRYFVVEAGPWLSGRRLILSPLALSKAEWTSRRMVLDATRTRVQTAPVLEEDALLSREHELELFRHYGWSMSGLRAISDEAPRSDRSRPPPLGPALRSVKAALSYGLEAEGSPAGQVDDFIVDDDTWLLPYLVVESKSWLSGRKVLTLTEHISAVDWEAGSMGLALPIAAIEEAPEYHPSAPVYDTRVLRALASPQPASERPSIVPAWLAELVASETWGTRGLRAALARIIQG